MDSTPVKKTKKSHNIYELEEDEEDPFLTRNDMSYDESVMLNGTSAARDLEDFDEVEDDDSTPIKMENNNKPSDGECFSRLSYLL